MNCVLDDLRDAENCICDGFAHLLEHVHDAGDSSISMLFDYVGESAMSIGSVVSLLRQHVARDSSSSVLQGASFRVACDAVLPRLILLTKISVLSGSSRWGLRCFATISVPRLVLSRLVCNVRRMLVVWFRRFFLWPIVCFATNG